MSYLTSREEEFCIVFGSIASLKPGFSTQGLEPPGVSWWMDSPLFFIHSLSSSSQLPGDRADWDIGLNAKVKGNPYMVCFQHARALNRPQLALWSSPLITHLWLADRSLEGGRSVRKIARQAACWEPGEVEENSDEGVCFCVQKYPPSSLFYCSPRESHLTHLFLELCVFLWVPVNLCMMCLFTDSWDSSIH